VAKAVASNDAAESKIKHMKAAEELGTLLLSLSVVVVVVVAIDLLAVAVAAVVVVVHAVASNDEAQSEIKHMNAAEELGEFKVNY